MIRHIVQGQAAVFRAGARFEHSMNRDLRTGRVSLVRDLNANNESFAHALNAGDANRYVGWAFFAEECFSRQYHDNSRDDKATGQRDSTLQPGSAISETPSHQITNLAAAAPTEHGNVSTVTIMTAETRLSPSSLPKPHITRPAVIQTTK